MLTLTDLIEAVPPEDADDLAFIYLDESGAIADSVTRRQLQDRCRQVAGHLQTLAAPGSIAVILQADGVTFIETFLGCAMAGLIPACVRPPRHARDGAALRSLPRILEDTGATLLIGDATALDLTRGAGDLPAARRLATEELRSAPARAWAPVVADAGQPAYVQYTSGSTSEPRGVVLTHHNVLANLRFMHEVFGRTDATGVVAWLPTFHDMGLVGHVLLPLFERETSVLMAPSTFLRDPAVWLHAFARFNVSRSATPAFALDYCVRRRLFDDPTLDLRNWKHAYVGAETVFPETLERFAEAFRGRGFQRDTFRPCYGLAEATLLAAGGTNDETVWAPRRAGDHPDAGARPLIGYQVHPALVDVKIVDPQTSARLPDGRIGEVWLAGESVARSYVGSPGASQATLRAGLAGEEAEHVRTGDQGFLENGRLYLTGRLKDIIIVRGINYSSDDMEYTARLANPHLRPGDACCAFAVQEETEERLVVVQEVDRHLAPAVHAGIVESIERALLDDHGLTPAAVVAIPAGTLARTANGKIARARCRDRYLAGGFVRLASRRSADAQPAGPADDRVAIIGIAGRFPGGANDPDGLWDLLVRGADAIEEVPAVRWNVDQFYDASTAVPGKMNTRWGGFLRDIDQFDPAFFGISSHEAPEIDPQQRLLMETSWRLFEDAGLTLDQLKGSDTSVFVGLSTSDYLFLKIKLTPGMEGFNAYSGLGNANSIAANRLSYLFDLRGPSLAVDTACSSSLTALHLAAESIRTGACSMAIAGGVNAILTPGPTITLSQFGMMAPDGRCKVFDEGADGYVRSEGCGLVMLKRASEAMRDGNRILAYIRASAIAHDGHTEGITMPGSSSQKDLIEKTLRLADIDASRVGYVEAHGTGTTVGDPAEVDQLKATYGAASGIPCYVGSVKANVGHLESAAGITSVIKTVLALRHGVIPPQIHVRRLNPRIDLGGSRLAIPSSACVWPDSDAARCAAISSFGFGGANAHMILEEGPRVDANAGAESEPDRPAIFTLSAKSDEALQISARQWADWFGAHPTAPLGAICHWQATRRTHFARRVTLVAESSAGLAAALREIADRPAGAVVSDHGDRADWDRTSGPRTPVYRGDLGSLPGHPFITRRCWIANATAEDLSTFATGANIVSRAPDRVEPPAAPVINDTHWMYEVQWASAAFTRQALVPPAQERDIDAVNWIVVGGDAALANAVAEAVHAAGYPSSVIARHARPGARKFAKGPSEGSAGIRRFAVPAACDARMYRDVLNHVLTHVSRAGTTTWRVIYLGGLDGAVTDGLTVAALQESQDLHGPGDALRLTHALLEVGRVIPMWIVTRHSQRVNPPDGDDARRLNVAQSPLWGFGKTLFLEHPELRGGLIDVDGADPASLAQSILAQAIDPEGEPCVAFRRGQRYVSRIVPVPSPGPPAAARFRDDGVYVVTGGLGGLGLRCARWLADRGARDIVLIGRSAPDARKVEGVRAIEASGARVETVACDVRDVAELAALFRRLKSDGRRVRGVLHLAGVNWFGKIRDLDVANFLDAIRVKVSATWALHELTREEDLDCFVLFSSVSALWGSVDLSHYTAANHFLDAISWHRSAVGLPALSVLWGPWAEVGMSAKARETDLLTKLGLRPMPPDGAIAVLEAGMARHTPVALLADIDWQRFRPFIEFSLSRSLFSNVARGVGLVGTSSQSIRHALIDTHVVDPAKARAGLTAIVRRALGSVVLDEGVQSMDIDHRFNLLGMDSLMAIAFAAELEKSIGIKLPNTLAYNYPTIRAVVEFISTTLLGAAPAGPASVDGRGRLFHVPASAAPAGLPRLFCFPYAGTGASVFGPWRGPLADCCELISVQYPGREDLAGEPTLRSIDALADLLVEAMPYDEDQRPCVFFGHSLGGEVAFEVACRLRDRGQPLPDHLIVSGCGLTRVPKSTSRHTWSDERFLDDLLAHRAAGRSDGQRDIARALLPILRADFEMVDAHVVTGLRPLPCPITVLGGTDDTMAPASVLIDWRTATTGEFRLREFPGRHDFIKEREGDVLQALRDVLQLSREVSPA